jgi:hypothetical protein
MSITSTVAYRAETRFIEAVDALRPYVGCFWVITAERGAMIRVVPDTSTSISIQLQHGRSSAWVLRGPLVEPQVRRFASAATLIGVRLRPGVAFLVTEIAADALVGRRISLRGTPTALSPSSHAPRARRSSTSNCSSGFSSID